MNNLDRLANALDGIARIIGAVAKLKKGDDLDCDWYCDNCGAHMNLQPGFHAGGTWECTKCGYENDVSTDNIRGTEWVTDERSNLWEIPVEPELEDPEDY